MRTEQEVQKMRDDFYGLAKQLKESKQPQYLMLTPTIEILDWVLGKEVEITLNPDLTSLLA